jgi:FixJ family two-component response regulator
LTDIPVISIIDDDSSVRVATDTLVRSLGYVAHTFASAEEFLRSSHISETSCVVADVQMPGMSGPELQKQMLATGVSLPIVYLTGHADVPMSISAMKNGAMDILLKPAEDEDVLSAIGAAIAKHEFVSAQEMKRAEVEGRLARLSAREREVMEFVIAGRLNKQIAGDLGITEKTVKAHRARVMEKLETRSVAAVVRMCELVGISPRQNEPVLKLGVRSLHAHELQ